MWHFTAQTWEQPSSGFMQVDSHVGMGSVQTVRTSLVLMGKKGADAGSRECLPQGHVFTTEGDLGQGAGVGEGTWHGFSQW